MQTAEKTAIKGIDITAYLVKDVPRAKAFYSETLGLRMTEDYGPQGGEFTLSDGTTFGLWKMEDGSWQAGSGVMFAVGDLPAAVELYKGRGAKIAEGVHESPKCLMAFGEDSEGNSFILHQLK